MRQRIDDIEDKMFLSEVDNAGADLGCDEIIMSQLALKTLREAS